MRQLPADTSSVIAYGALFGDGQAASLRIAGNEVAWYRPRLWSMYTNLQPSVRADGSLGPWSELCRPCHQVILAAMGQGGHVGFQAAGATVNDTARNFRTAIDTALRRYEPSFLETGWQRIDRFEPYLLTGDRAVQARIARAADPCPRSATTCCCAVSDVRKSGIPSPSRCDAEVDAAPTPCGVTSRRRERPRSMRDVLRAAREPTSPAGSTAPCRTMRTPLPFRRPPCPMRTRTG